MDQKTLRQFKYYVPEIIHAHLNVNPLMHLFRSRFSVQNPAYTKLKYLFLNHYISGRTPSCLLIHMSLKAHKSQRA
jgi:hypothetical protein